MRKMFSIACLSLISFLLSFTVSSANAQPDPRKDDSKLKYDELLLKQRQTDATDVMNFVKKAAELVKKDGEKAFPEFRVKGSSWFTGDTYVFIFDMDGIREVYPPDTSEEGANINKLSGIQGEKLGPMLFEAVNDPAGEGWTHYQWGRPDDNKPAWKSTFLKKVQAPSGKEYVVGSSSYTLKMSKKFITDIVDSSAALIEKKGRKAFKILRDKRSKYRFKNTYVFVTKADGTEVINPGMPKLKDTDLIDVQDVSCKYLVKEYIRATEKNGTAWIEYVWPKPGDNTPYPKTTYVRKVSIDGDTYIVGAGYYLDEYTYIGE